MADLTDDELTALSRNLTVNPGDYGLAGIADISRLVRELQRRRAAQAAGREHVERVVKETLERNRLVDDTFERWADRAARRVADRLSAPALSSDDVEALAGIRRSLPRGGHPGLVVLDRLIAGAKP